MRFSPTMYYQRPMERISDLPETDRPGAMRYILQDECFMMYHRDEGWIRITSMDDGFALHGMCEGQQMMLEAV